MTASRADKIITGVLSLAERSFFKTSSPGIPGNPRSSRTAEYDSASRAACAATPSCTQSTTKWYRSKPLRMLVPSIWSSSTKSNRIGFLDEMLDGSERILPYEDKEGRAIAANDFECFTRAPL